MIYENQFSSDIHRVISMQTDTGYTQHIKTFSQSPSSGPLDLMTELPMTWINTFEACATTRYFV